MRRVLVDGYNLLLRTGRGADERAREQLVRDASRYRGTRGVEVTIVFDGRSATGTTSARHQPGVRVEFARDADDAIVDHVRRDPRPRSMVVMTADRELSERVQALGAKVEDGTQLLAPTPKRRRRGIRSIAPDKPSTVSDQEIDYWEREFARREDRARDEDDDF